LNSLIHEIASESKEYVPDAEPAERVRQQGEPVFLKPLPQGDFLPSLVTILQTIPSCREIFFDVTHLGDYGYNSHWWEGDQINIPRESLPQSDETVNHSLLYEVQRLMAFLEGSQRSYGSADALAQLTMRGRPLDDWATEPLFARFMSCLENAVQSASEQDSNSMFRIRRIGSDVGRWEKQESCYVAISESDFGLSSDPDLYEVLDRHVWGRSWPTAEPEYWLDDNVAAIVVLHIAKPPPKAPKRRLNIPQTMCADRYLRSKAEHIKNMREETRDLAAQIDKTQAIISKIQMYRPADGLDLNAFQLLCESIDFLEKRQKNREEVEASGLEASRDFEGESSDSIELATDRQGSATRPNPSGQQLPSEWKKGRDVEVLAKLKEIVAELETKVSSMCFDQYK